MIVILRKGKRFNKLPRSKLTGYRRGVVRESVDSHRKYLFARGQPRGISPSEI